MTFRKPSSKILRSLCAEVDLDDGVDPRVSSRKGTSRKKAPRKARQLCGQVAETLSHTLASQGHDDVLQSLHVVTVEPAPDASRLLVTVTAPRGDRVDPARVLDHLQRASGRLRCEVAAAITRKRAPTLVYRFAVPAASRAMDP
jgi:ribosome-binding factor A